MTMEASRRDGERMVDQQTRGGLVLIMLTTDRDPTTVSDIIESNAVFFGDADTINRYVRDSSDPAFDIVMAFDVEDDDDRPVGVALTKKAFDETLELHLLAVNRDDHGKGIGATIVHSIAEEARHHGYRMLTVRVLPEGRGHAGWNGTRAFYRRVGFLPIVQGGRTTVLARPLPELEHWELPNV